RQPEALEAYDSYLKYAKELQKVDTTSDLKKAFYKACEEDYLPFVFLEGSNGTGKTQLALTLQEEFSKKVPEQPVYYLLRKKMDYQLQNVYKYFLEPSKCLTNCYQQDARLINFTTRDELLDEELYVYGFIDMLLFGNKKYGHDLKQKIDNKWKEANKRPIMIVDEFPGSCTDISGDIQNEPELNLVRNGFLSVGIPLIILGSDISLFDIFRFTPEKRGR
ncbi:hypothetical protein MP638_006496, partial [Amoeboaphelidium occidentale]